MKKLTLRGMKIVDKAGNIVLTQTDHPNKPGVHIYTMRVAHNDGTFSEARGRTKISSEPQKLTLDE